MQMSTDIRTIKAAIWCQAFKGTTSVSCPIGQVVAIRRRKGQLLALVRGCGRWFPVDEVLIMGRSFSGDTCRANRDSVKWGKDIAPSLEPLKGKRLMLYSTNQLDDVEEAVEHLEESKERVSLDNVNNWLIENGRRTISNEKIDDILIDLGYW